ncbi:hypothetical protein FSP39_016728 [Pinctada imbricata]|uniref:THAP-type domain-containing protein n=1 Tax=Pinctada imbricata TaxID=66713 RepID=A0AA88Y989_PINIB|nr:hypothetical protein FSP39_016728 [Pinctada imbricata]
MVRCSALNCTVRTGQGVSFFRYPKDPSRRKVWIHNVKRKDFQPSKIAGLCERHFVDDDFKISRSFAESIGYELKELQLKESAVPTVFDYGTPAEDTQKRKHRRSSNATEKRRKLEEKKMRTFGTQTEVTAITEDTHLDESFSSFNDSFSDPNWLPEEDVSCDAQSYSDDITPAKERKFIVFESQLDLLFQRHCSYCGDLLQVVEKNVQGSGLFVTCQCTCGSKFQWESQPSSGTMPLGNLLLALLFSGSSPSHALNMLKHMSVASISDRTFFLMQKMYLVPTIESVFKTQQVDLIQDILIRNRPVRIGGDGRCCSPGHTAKFGSYTVMDLSSDKILDIQLVQSNEVANSHNMEIEGLLRSLTYLEEEGVEISHLVTDRHSQIKKYMREKRPDITHWFDVWHVAKGIYKKLVAAGKKKGCESVGEWARSVSNHLYWCASSSQGDGELVKEKWLSLLNHVTNVHEGHGDLYPRCEHDPTEDRLWLQRGRFVFESNAKVSPMNLNIGANE